MIACDSGTSDAPKMPCSRRNSTICVSEPAMPHSAEAATKPRMLTSRYLRRPRRSVRKPVIGITIDDATM